MLAEQNQIMFPFSPTFKHKIIAELAESWIK